MSSEFPPRDEDRNPDDSANPRAANEDSHDQPGQYPAPTYSPQSASTLPQSPGQYPSPQYASGQFPPGRYHPGFDPRVIQGSMAAVVLSWLVILGITLLLFSTTVWMQLYGEQQAGETSKAELMQVNLQAKMLLGQEQFLNMQNGFGVDEDVEAGKPARIPGNNNALSGLNVGPPESRYSYAILLNEFDGIDAALEQLDATDDLIERLDYDQTENQVRLREIVGSMLEQYDEGDYDSSSIPSEDREFLKSQLGWVGELGLLPKESPDVAARSLLEQDARNSLLILLGGGLLVIAMLLAGIVAAPIFFIITASGGIRSRLVLTPRGRIYAETFAIWMLGFVGLQVGLGLLGGFIGETNLFFATPFIFFASLMVLVWPVIRGIPFSQMRRDIGWQIGNPIVEACAGVVSYVALVPFMAFSFVFVILIMIAMAAVQSNADANELSSVGGPGHPIQEQIAAGDPLIFLGVFVTACIAAPIVEETMFRGVLYRHLRDSSWQWATFGSVLFSTIFNSLIFAAIHPQGLFGIPILATLAIGFSLVREWRGSLIGPMFMHAINNGLVTCLLFLIM